MVRGDFTLLFFAALLGVFAGAVLVSEVLVSSGGVGASAFNGSVFYLYPSRCVNCGSTVSGSCEGCVAYYSDAGVLAAVSADVGVSLVPFVSDSVEEPVILVARDGVLYLADARTKFNIAGSLCRVLGNELACGVFTSRLAGLRKCFESFGVSADSLVYEYNDGCSYCNVVSGAVGKLVETESGVGGKYKVFPVDSLNESQLRVLDYCAGDLVNTRFVPNLFCPATGRVKSGEVGFSELRDFADECLDAAK